MAILTAAQAREALILDDGTKFSDALLTGLVAEFEQVAKDHLGYPVSTATFTVTVDGTDCPTLDLPVAAVTAVSSITIDGTAFTTAQRADVDVRHRGALSRPERWYGRKVTVVGSHGPASASAGMVRACREYVRAKATTSVGNLPRNGSVPIDGQGGFTQVPVRSKPTGIPVVDDLLEAETNYLTVMVGG